MAKIEFAGVLVGLSFLASIAMAQTPAQHVPEVPARLDFVRTIDLELVQQYVMGKQEIAETFRFRSRYLDPDVNYFIGLASDLHYFDTKLRVNDNVVPDTAHFLWNWGIDMGFKHGRHLWEFDLMGALVSNALAPVFGLHGEHEWQSWSIYHYSDVSLFSNDMILDLDGGVRWHRGALNLSLGYRIFTGLYENRNGPRFGLLWRFESPKIPFIFPSLG